MPPRSTRGPAANEARVAWAPCSAAVRGTTTTTTPTPRRARPPALPPAPADHRSAAPTTRRDSPRARAASRFSGRSQEREVYWDQSNQSREPTQSPERPMLDNEFDQAANPEEPVLFDPIPALP